MDNNRPVLFISMPLGWSILDMVYTGIVDQLTRVYEVVLLLPEHFQSALLEQIKGKNVIVETLVYQPEPLSWKLLRRLRKKVFLEVNRFETERIKERARKRHFYQRLGGVLLRYISRLPMSKKLISIIEDIDFLVNKDRFYSNIFKKYCPALVMGTSPFQYAEETLMRAAMSLGIPCVCFIPSWDNISSKGVINQRYHRVLVWNKVMHDEILNGYHRYKSEQVKVIGVPRFDIYKTPPDLDYPSWCQQYGLDPNRRTILYSTTSPWLFSYDPVIIEHILDNIKLGKLPKNIQLLVRCHPHDDARRYEHLLGNRSVGICRSSLPPGQGRERWLPLSDELIKLRDCIMFSTMNINVASTMTLDAAACGKPILNVAFDGNEKLPYEKSARRFYDYSHYKRVTQSGAVRICHSYEDLFQGIIDYLENPELDAEKRSALADMMCAFNDGKSSERCVQELVHMGKEPLSDPQKVKRL